MKKIIGFLIFISLFTSIKKVDKLCLSASQYRTFPIGFENNKLVVLDVLIIRASDKEIAKWNNIEHEDLEYWDKAWQIKTEVKIYDKYQKTEYKRVIDSSYTLSNSYKDSLAAVYSRGFRYIKDTYCDLEYLKPEYISFCDFKNKCNLVSTRYDSINKRNYINYKKKDYYIPFLSDSTNQIHKKRKYLYDFSFLKTNSIRKYVSEKKEVIVIHAQTGTHGLPDKPQEYTPDFKFNAIENCSYEEPMLHHGFGIDIFIVKE